MIATRIRTLPHPAPQIDQVLWSLDTPVTYTLYRIEDDGTYSETLLDTNHIVTSASTCGTYVTYIFPADATGKILAFGELPGSKAGILDHDRVIAAFRAHYSQPSVPHSLM